MQIKFDKILGLVDFPVNIQSPWILQFKVMVPFAFCKCNHKYMNKSKPLSNAVIANLILRLLEGSLLKFSERNEIFRAVICAQILINQPFLFKEYGQYISRKNVVESQACHRCLLPTRPFILKYFRIIFTSVKDLSILMCLCGSIKV